MTKIGTFLKNQSRKKRDRKREAAVDQRIADFYRAVANDEKCNTEESRNEAARVMEDLLDAMGASPIGQMLDAFADDMGTVFKDRYRNIFASAPSSPLPRIRYFCGVLLELAPFTAGEDQQVKYFALSDFRNVLSGGIEGAVAEWTKSDTEAGTVYSQLEPEYPFYEMDFNEDNMGTVLGEILTKLRSIDPMESEGKKKEFIWELLRLSEVGFRMQFAVCDVLGKRIAAGYPLPGCDEIRGWMPDFLAEDHLLQQDLRGDSSI